MNPVHIHNILEWLAAEEEAVSEKALLKRISDAYGPDVVFCSCADYLFTKEQVVEFLLSKNKIVIESGGIRINRSAESC